MIQILPVGNGHVTLICTTLHAGPPLLSLLPLHNDVFYEILSTVVLRVVKSMGSAGKKT